MHHAFTTTLPTSSALGLPHDVSGAHAVAPAAPPDLVQRFDALMQRVQVPGAMEPGDVHLSQGTVARIDDMLKEPAALLSRMSTVDIGSMSMQEMTAFQMQTVIQASAMSMKEDACLSVVNSAKKSVSDLMKNQ
jgi:hypothetical protein